MYRVISIWCLGLLFTQQAFVSLSAAVESAAASIERVEHGMSARPALGAQLRQQAAEGDADRSPVDDEGEAEGEGAPGCPRWVVELPRNPDVATVSGVSPPPDWRRVARSVFAVTSRGPPA